MSSLLRAGGYAALTGAQARARVLTGARARAWVLTWALVWVLAGCAPLPPTSAPVPPARGARPSGAAPVRPTAPAPRSIVPADSTPSREALEVLDSIPEPLTPGQRVPPPSNGAANATSDTTAHEAPGADVPVPEPTLPLGDRRRAVADTTAASGSAAPSAPAAPTSPTAPGASPPSSSPPPPASSSASADTCWRVQVLAPLDADAAIRARDAASSLLLVPMVIEREQGRYKVRTKNCLTRTAADLLRRRAVESGFAKAFRIIGARQ